MKGFRIMISFEMDPNKENNRNNRLLSYKVEWKTKRILVEWSVMIIRTKLILSRVFKLISKVD